MSWYGGSQMTPTLSARAWNAPWISDRLCSRFPCVSITPLGVPVLPDVYWRKASVSAVTAGARHAEASSGDRASVASHFTSRSSGACSNRNSAIDSTNDVVNTTVARASWMMARSRGSVRSSREGSGGYAGTATAPADRHPKNPATYSRPGGYSSTTRSPARACSATATAIALARDASPAYVSAPSSPSSRKV
ncbi:hypothetical protein ASNO1_77610 [Corallococcus caeni]|uniref:Uncharacterized protein n=1 Tax=Corallococcus caeni TaxID=3082388 RepID=A0ABQ6R5I9_9BACT|nr:hypothetical protein ASNO1_77610 [Corallococcus sp. NO1]